MIARLIERFRLWRNPPKVDDVYWTDSFSFLGGRPMEHVLHGLTDKNGHPRAAPIYGDLTYRMLIRAEEGLCYTIQCEVLVQNVSSLEKFWAFRVQPRKIDKKAFVQMILDGEIEKDEQLF